MIFADKVALVTGGSRGIGRATALKLAQAGCDVAIAYYNDESSAKEVVDSIKNLGRKAIAVKANVADLSSVKELIKIFSEHFSKLDFLISNAASGVLKPVCEMSTKHFRWCMETNALALQHLVCQAAELLVDNGRVIALSSLGASRAIPNYAFIGASKAALEALVRSLSLEFPKLAINTVSAGVVDTDALKYFPNRDELLAEYKSRTLTDKGLTPEYVADTVYLLCLPEAGMIKGQVIYVDAGYNILG